VKKQKGNKTDNGTVLRKRGLESRKSKTDNEGMYRDSQQDALCWPNWVRNEI